MILKRGGNLYWRALRRVRRGRRGVELRGEVHLVTVEIFRVTRGMAVRIARGGAEVPTGKR